VAQKSVEEAEESLRLTKARVAAGANLPSDALRAASDLSGRRQDLLLAINAFYDASVSLTVTLHLDPTVTLVPKPGAVDPVKLVDDGLEIERLLGIAVLHRPDLEAARRLLAAATSERKSVAWGALGPQLQAAYTYGGIEPRLSGDSLGLQEQKRGSASLGWALGLSTFGQIKLSRANARIAATQVEQQLDQIRAQVVKAQLTSRTTAQLLPIAENQVESAEEALRLSQSNLEHGNGLLLEVLQSQNEVDSARLRYADAVVRYNQSQITLLASIGLLDRDSLLALPSSQSATSQPATTPTGE
jgi:outer membrane protein TolC